METDKDHDGGLRIFINYRRDDTQPYVDHLYSDLIREWPPEQVFMDTDTIPAGMDFVEVIDEAVGRSDVLIAVIGRRWFDATDETGHPRLENPEDFVRLEIEAALARGIRVIPLLVGGARPPASTDLPESIRSLARRNAFEISDGARRPADVARLLRELHQVDLLKGSAGQARVAAGRDRPTPGTAAEERKVITTLFCELIGPEASRGSADPEDLDRMLEDFFTMARRQIEGHGGVLEQTIGEAVIGVFGVPAAHEDDPERAVRAALRIIEDASENHSLDGEPIRLSVGIDTGQALVHLGMAGEGEGFLRGDAITAASGLQSVAPPMGVVVGLATHEATSGIFDYEELEPATLKGRASPVRIFRAKGTRARLGIDLTRTHDTPFIGREIDLALLRGLFDKSISTKAVQLVSIMGEPGIGKSRIVAELRDHVDARPELITWRQGRCLPYGEGITFWALGEILKAHAGILESDPAEVAASKLDQVLPEGEERPWFRQRLLPLLGIEATSSAEREELFTAWQRFLEQIAEANPTVVVFEDLHWADEAMLAFLEHLADHAEGVPLLIVGTARPELFERHPTFGAGLRRANSINLVPLSEAETARLVAALLQSAVIPAELQQPIFDRAGGNPLYAEEFVRLLKDKDLIVQEGSSWVLREGAEVPFPDSVQSLIAARLDTLAPDAKSMLADAAVIGKIFWAGAIAQMGDRDPSAVTQTLRELSRKELVRAERHSSIEGEAEYAFWHILTRDVAYSQLPRASRASRHVAAARWIESKAPERVEDLAEVLAHHYVTALELARAAGQTEQATELEAPALKFLSLAGERALGLDTGAALVNLEKALALTPPGHPERAEALYRFGEAANQAAKYTVAADALGKAIDAFRAQGDISAAGRAMIAFGRPLMRLGDARIWTLPMEAVALLEPLGPSAALLDALNAVAANESAEGRSEEAIRVVDRALALAEELGLPRPARAIEVRGITRADRGDPGGLQDYREAIALAIEAGQGHQVAIFHNNLAFSLGAFEGPTASLEVLRVGIDFARTRGLVGSLNVLRQSTIDVLIDTGVHEEALEVAAEIAPQLEASGDVFVLAQVRAAQARIFALRGMSSDLAEVLVLLESATRGSDNPQLVAMCLGSAALVHAGLGQNAQAAALLTEVEASPGVRDNTYYSTLLDAMVRSALAIGERALAERLVAGLEPRYPLVEHALVAANAALTEARGDLQAAADAYADAADRWERFGVVPEQAFALLGQGRCLIALSHPTEAAPVLQHAREIFLRLQAAPALAETDALLQQATALSS